MEVGRDVGIALALRGAKQAARLPQEKQSIDTQATTCPHKGAALHERPFNNYGRPKTARNADQPVCSLGVLATIRCSSATDACEATAPQSGRRAREAGLRVAASSSGNCLEVKD